MSDSVEIIGVDDRERWTAAHAEGGLPSQSWGYAWGLSAAGIDPKLAVVQSGGSRMLLPFFERSFQGTTDVATILGLSGASITPASSEPVEHWRRFARDAGWVAGYIQLSPMIDAPVAPQAEIATVNEVLLLELRDSLAITDFAESIRQKIRKADAIAKVVDDCPRLATAVAKLYPSTVQRSDAPAFSATTLERWAKNPDSLVLGAEVGGSLEAVSIFNLAAAHAEYHLNASSERGRDLAAWLIWKAVERLRARGVRTLNLGGGAKPGDGIYEFKRRFGALAHPLRAIRQIYDRRRYDELCASTGADASERWFPAYRARR
jgi:hypothetical protein